MAGGALGRLAPYQWAWLRDPSPLRVGVWARRTGKSTVATLDLAAEAVGIDLVHGEALPPERTANGLIVATNAEQAAALLDQTRRWVEALGAMVGVLDPLESATQDRLKLRSGREIRALPGSNPRAFRGYGGRVLWDEAAHAADPEEVWRALLPVAGPSHARPGGFRIDVVSTPIGPAGVFYRLAEGDLAETASVHRVTIHDAARAGLPVDVAALEVQVGDPEIWASEYEARFTSPGGALVPADLVDAAACDLVEVPREGRLAVAAGWDPARTRDGSSLVEVARDEHGVVHVRRVETLRRVAWAEQERHVASWAREVGRLAIDRAGVGMASAERLATAHASVLEVPMNSGPTRDAVLSGLADVFRRGRIRLPREFRDLRRSILSIRREVTATGAMRVVIPRTREGHADEAVALALAIYALGEAVDYDEIDRQLAAVDPWLPKSEARRLAHFF